MNAPTLVSIIMIVGATACGSDDGDSNDTSVADTAPAETSGETTSETTTADTTVADTSQAETDAAPDVSAPTVTYLFHGSANGADLDHDVRVECTLDALIDGVVETTDGFTGVAHGEVFRNVFPDTRRFEFQALMAGPVSLTRTHPSEADLRMVGEQPDEAKPFWLGLEVLAGVEGDGGDWLGDFDCRPIDVDYGPYTDDLLTVTGHWTLERIVTP